ncbi:hypothetical protein [Weissella cibaria]|uniref:hypothetical protein n=1 Tax=Weissella cibaria TaxID=137591 RepID=UPI00223B0775|nr:hypothetical protein [Weissella cibaria]MCS9999748.1 hypothetical protein [Weissella cibaria]
MAETKERYVTYEEFNDFKHHDFQEVKDDLKDLREDVTEMRADLRVMDTRLTNVEKTLETFATKDEMQLMFHDHSSANRKEMYRALGVMTAVLDVLMSILQYLN